MNTKRQTGFTLVEMIITMVVAGIIIPTVGIALRNLTVVNHQAADLAAANLLAQNKVEALRSLGYNSINSGTVDFSNELPAAMSSPKGASYTVSLPQTGIKQIDINISYTEYNSTRNLVYRTYISELGVDQ